MVASEIPTWLAGILVVQFLGAIGWAINQKVIIEKLRTEVDELRRDQARADTIVSAMGRKLDDVILGNARIEEQVKTLFEQLRELSQTLRERKDDR